MNKRFGFSLVEMLITLITASLIMSALTPVITKKLNSNAITVGTEVEQQQEFEADCTKWGEHCVFCTEEKCSLCSKDCLNDEYTVTAICECAKCNTKHDNCKECTTSKCKKCFAGYGLTSNNTCKECEAGYYSDGSTDCKAASAGYYVANKGASTQTKCGVGTYQDKTGQSGCIPCTAGSYQNEEGKTSCKTCEIDYMCTGGNNRTQCAANQGAVAGSSSCSNCPANCADCQIPGNCLKCNSGYYLSNKLCYKCTAGYSCNGTATKTQCSAGYYAAEGSSSCSQCNAGQFAAAGASSCSTCASGSTSAAGASTCFTCSSKWTNCTKCSATACSECASTHKLSSGSCVPKINCTGSNLMQVNGVCITKYNMGDSFGIPSAAGVTLTSPNNGCYANKCCWKGANTASTSSGCGTQNGGYSSCTRTVCTWHAANAICSNFTEQGVTWRLPTVGEMANWHLSSQNLGTSGLMLCDWATTAYGSAKCHNTSRCPNSSSSTGVNQCYPMMLWASDGRTMALYEGSWYAESSMTSLDTSSVRCVTSMQ